MNIRETVTEALKGAGLEGYEGQAAPVVRALEDRETVIVSNLVAYAVDQGLDRATALRGIADCGLDVAGSAPTDEDPRIAAMEAQVEEMQATLRLLRGDNEG